MAKQHIERYIQLRRQMTELETELEELKPHVVEHVHQVGDKLEFGDYILRSQVTKSWAYTSEVNTLQKQLTERKREEVAEGKAQLKKGSRFVIMTPLKKPPGER